MDLDIAGSNPVTHPFSAILARHLPHTCLKSGRNLKNGEIGLRSLLGGAAQNFDLDVLPQFEGIRFEQSQLDLQYACVGGPAGILGASLTGDDSIGDLLDLALPDLAGITLRGDNGLRPEDNSGNVEFIDFGLDSQPGQDRKSVV